ncbi:MAG: DinB family protein [Acidobacteriota bacterium]
MSYAPRAELTAFVKTRQRTLSLIAGLSEDDMAQRPGSDAWSVGELADHLLRTEGLWRSEVEELIRLERSGRQPYLNRLLADFPLPIVGRLPRPLLGLVAVPLTAFNTFLQASFFESFLRLRALPAPAPPALVPRAGRSGEVLRRELDDGMRQTAAVFEDNDDLRFRRQLYQHPLIGIVSSVGLLRLITVHEQRHQDQLVAILRKLGLRSGG